MAAGRPGIRIVLKKPPSADGSRPVPVPPLPSPATEAAAASTLGAAALQGQHSGREAAFYPDAVEEMRALTSSMMASGAVVPQIFSSRHSASEFAMAGLQQPWQGAMAAPSRMAEDPAARQQRLAVASAAEAVALADLLSSPRSTHSLQPPLPFSAAAEGVSHHPSGGAAPLPPFQLPPRLSFGAPPPLDLSFRPPQAPSGAPSPSGASAAPERPPNPVLVHPMYMPASYPSVFYPPMVAHGEQGGHPLPLHAEGNQHQHPLPTAVPAAAAHPHPQAQAPASAMSQQGAHPLPQRQQQQQDAYLAAAAAAAAAAVAPVGVVASSSRDAPQVQWGGGGAAAAGVVASSSRDAPQVQWGGGGAAAAGVVASSSRDAPRMQWSNGGAAGNRPPLPVRPASRATSASAPVDVIELLSDSD